MSTPLRRMQQDLDGVDAVRAQRLHDLGIGREDRVEVRLGQLHVNDGRSWRRDHAASGARQAKTFPAGLVLRRRAPGGSNCALSAAMCFCAVAACCGVYTWTTGGWDGLGPQQADGDSRTTSRNRPSGSRKRVRRRGRAGNSDQGIFSFGFRQGRLGHRVFHAQDFHECASEKTWRSCISSSAGPARSRCLRPRKRVSACGSWAWSPRTTEIIKRGAEVQVLDGAAQHGRALGDVDGDHFDVAVFAARRRG